MLVNDPPSSIIAWSRLSGFLKTSCAHTRGAQIWTVTNGGLAQTPRPSTSQQVVRPARGTGPVTKSLLREHSHFHGGGGGLRRVSALDSTAMPCCRRADLAPLERGPKSWSCTFKGCATPPSLRTTPPFAGNGVF